MDAKLESNIQELGGKHGVLAYLRENVPELRGHLVPSLVFGIREGLGEQARILLEWACDSYESSRVIVRSSEQNDHRGLVDAMPTEDGNLEDVDGLIQDVQAKCLNERIIDYSEKEGGDYDPERVTISVAPFINGPRGLVTEHPNIPGVLCVDVVKKLSEKVESLSHESLDFLDGRCLNVSVYDDLSEVYARHGLRLRDLVRESGAFDDDDVLQYEFVLGQSGSFLTQVKWFAKRNLTNCSSAEVKAVMNKPFSRGYRNFGITGKDGIVLPYVKGDERKAFLDFEAQNPGVPYAFHLSHDGLGKRLKLDQIPKHMRAYLPAVKPPLTHQNTRFVQNCLKRDGVAFLNTVLNARHAKADNVRVTSDGLNISVRAA